MPMVSDWCQCIMKKNFIGCQWILKSLFVGIGVFCTANGFYITFHWHSSMYFHDDTGTIQKVCIIRTMGSEWRYFRTVGKVLGFV